MEAPEKLYLSENIYNTFVYQVPDSDDKTQVEYIRMDVFIGKACEWLNGNFRESFDNTEVITGFSNTTEVVEDFRKAMEE